MYVYVGAPRTGAAAAAGAVGQEELRLPPRCRGDGTLRGGSGGPSGEPRGTGLTRHNGRRPGSDPSRRRLPRSTSRRVTRPGPAADVRVRAAGGWLAGGCPPPRPASQGLGARGSSDRDIWVKSSAFSAGRGTVVTEKVKITELSWSPS